MLVLCHDIIGRILAVITLTVLIAAAVAPQTHVIQPAAHLDGGILIAIGDSEPALRAAGQSGDTALVAISASAKCSMAGGNCWSQSCIGDYLPPFPSDVQLEAGGGSAVTMYDMSWSEIRLGQSPPPPKPGLS